MLQTWLASIIYFPKPACSDPLAPAGDTTLSCCLGFRETGMRSLLSILGIMQPINPKASGHTNRYSHASKIQDRYSHEQLAQWHSATSTHLSHEVSPEHPSAKKSDFSYGYLSFKVTSNSFPVDHQKVANLHI